MYTITHSTRWNAWAILDPEGRYVDSEDSYQAAYERCNRLNTRLAAEQAMDALEARAAERDADEDRAALHPRYVRQGGDVYDTNAGRWYCTVASWPYSPAARDGAVLGEPARKAA